MFHYIRTSTLPIRSRKRDGRLGRLGGRRSSAVKGKRQKPTAKGRKQKQNKKQKQAANSAGSRKQNGQSKKATAKKQKKNANSKKQKQKQKTKTKKQNQKAKKNSKNKKAKCRGAGAARAGPKPVMESMPTPAHINLAVGQAPQTLISISQKTCPCTVLTLHCFGDRALPPTAPCPALPCLDPNKNKTYERTNERTNERTTNARTHERTKNQLKSPRDLGSCIASFWRPCLASNRSLPPPWPLPWLQQNKTYERTNERTYVRTHERTNERKIQHKSPRDLAEFLCGETVLKFTSLFGKEHKASENLREPRWEIIVVFKGNDRPIASLTFGSLDRNFATSIERLTSEKNFDDKNFLT